MVEVGVELAIKAVQGEIDLDDINVVSKIFSDMAGVEAKMTRLTKGYNFYQFTLDSIIFGL